MTRKLLSVAVVFLVAAGVGLAEDDKGKGKGKGKNKDMRVVGMVKKVDIAAGTFTIATKSKKDTSGKDEEFQISDATKVTVFRAGSDDKKELTGKEGMRQIKDGARVMVLRSDGKVTEVIVNPARKKS